MKINWKKVALFGLPLLAAGGIFYWVSKKNAGPGPNADATGKTAPKKVPAPAPKNNDFPLRNGSKNSFVTKLQTALGISADGIFGTQTESALRTAAGITSIADEAELNSVLAKIASGAAAADKTARATDIIHKFATGNYSMQPTVTAFWKGVNKDYTGALQPTGMGITMYKGTKYNNEDFKVTGLTKLGMLIIEVFNSPTLEGTYTGDPATITLV